MISAGTSRPCSARPASRCGSPASCRATSTTWPPPATTCSACCPLLKDLPVLADPGYEGAGVGIHVPVKKPPGVEELDINTRTRNALIRSARCLGERGFALLTQRWRALQHVTASPSRIGVVAQAALVLVQFEHKMIT
jgi:hypothetical protein